MRFQCGLYVRNNDFLDFLIEAVFNGTITVSWAWKNIDKNEEKFQKVLLLLNQFRYSLNSFNSFRTEAVII